MTTDYRLPENAEASILGCVLLCPDVKPEVEKLISADDFSSPAYGAMFAAAMELEQPDSVEFRELVKQRGYVLPDGFFNALTEIAINRGNVGLDASLLREDSMRRKLLALSTEMQEAVAAEQEVGDIVSTASSKLHEIEQGTITADLATPADSTKLFFDHRAKVEAGNGAVPTEFQPLDTILSSGMLRSGLYVLAARPGMGKTTLGLQIADNIATGGGVDYLGRVTPTNQNVSRYEAITAISGNLKSLAVELGVPVLALAQLNRENTSRTDKRPQLSDLRDSGAIEQDADGVIMLHRSDYYETSDRPIQPWEALGLEIIVRKNRHGQIGTCYAGFFPATGRIIKRSRGAT